MSYTALHATEETAGGAIDKFAVLDLSSGDVVENGTNTDISYGVAQDSADSGDKVDVVLEGKTKAIAADGDISKGDLLQVAANGEVETDDGSTSGRYLIGRALEDSGAQGDYIQIIFRPEYTAQA